MDGTGKKTTSVVVLMDLMQLKLKLIRFDDEISDFFDTHVNQRKSKNPSKKLLKIYIFAHLNILQ